MSQSTFGTWPTGQDVTLAWAIAGGIAGPFVGTPGLWGPGPATLPAANQIELPYQPDRFAQLQSGNGPFALVAQLYRVALGAATPKALIVSPGTDSIIVTASADFDVNDVVWVTIVRPASFEFVGAP